MKLVQRFLLLVVAACLLFGCVSCGYSTRAPKLSVEDRNQIDASGMHYIMYEDVPYYGVSDFWGVGKDKEETEIYVNAIYQRGDFWYPPIKKESASTGISVGQEELKFRKRSIINR